MKNRWAAPAVWCLLAAALFGASTPVARALLDGIGPLTLAGLFYLGAALGTAPWALRGHAGVARRREDRFRLAGAVLFGGVVGPVLVLLGLRMAPAASVALWLNLEAPATALLGWAFFREHVDRRTWIAAALVWGASVVLAAPEGFGGALAALLVLGGCFAWGLDNNLTSVIAGYTPAQTTFVKGLAAGTVNLVLGVLIEGAPSMGLGIVLALVVGIFAYGASIVLYVAGAQQLGATRAQMIFATAPFWGVGLAWVGLGEPVLLAQVLAAAGMVGALVLLFTERHGHPHEHQAMHHTHWHRHDDGHHDHTHPGGNPWGWHIHEHGHEPMMHTHPHRPDLHHRHGH
ncbi:MAG: DMT family transporter [Pseudomonadota bacterium]|nr:DMT family transporter [Pseudomonadota bacterium]